MPDDLATEREKITQWYKDRCLSMSKLAIEHHLEIVKFVGKNGSAELIVKKKEK